MLSEIGPPVLNGGVSTLLAFILLIWSKSYVFGAFFKVSDFISINRLSVCSFLLQVFIGVVLFGLFHGLLLLPMLLGIIGPPSHREHFRRSRISRRLEIDDDDFLNQTTINSNNLENVKNFNVDLYEHHATMDSITKTISPISLMSPPANENVQLFLNYQRSPINTNTDVILSHLNNNNINNNINTPSTVVQESSI